MHARPDDDSELPDTVADLEPQRHKHVQGSGTSATRRAAVTSCDTAAQVIYSGSINDGRWAHVAAWHHREIATELLLEGEVGK